MALTLPPVLVRADLAHEYDDRKQIVAAALEAGYTNIILRPEDSALTRLGRYTGITADGKYLTYNGERVGAILTLAGAEDMEEAYSMKDTVPYLVITPSDWKVIPLENLISRFQNSATRVYVCVTTPEEAKLAQRTLPTLQGFPKSKAMSSRTPNSPQCRLRRLCRCRLVTASVSTPVPFLRREKACL